MFEWNRGFLRAMLDRIVPKAGDPQQVADLIVQIMCCEEPKLHYTIGSDARYFTIMQWLGLTRWLEKKIFRAIKRSRRLENQRETKKKMRRKQKKKSN
jgi:hypothetical protein